MLPELGLDDSVKSRTLKVLLVADAREPLVAVSV